MKVCSFFQSNLDNSIPLGTALPFLPEKLKARVKLLEKSGRGTEIVLGCPLKIPLGRVRLGGQSANSALALSALGADVLLSVNSGKGILGKYCGKVRLAGNDGPARVHHVLEGKNRIILTYDPENLSGKIPKEFVKRARSEKFDFGIMSGLHLAKSPAPAISLGKAIRKNGVFVHFEFNGKAGVSGKALLGNAKGAFDSLGMNVEEAEELSGKKWEKLIGLSGARLVVIHGETESYAFFEKETFSEEAIARSLDFAGLVAASHALTGKDLSEKGMQRLEGRKLLNSPENPPIFSEKGKVSRVVVSSWKIGKKATSLGLGDSFAGGFLFSLMREPDALLK